MQSKVYFAHRNYKRSLPKKTFLRREFLHASKQQKKKEIAVKNSHRTSAERRNRLTRWRQARKVRLEPRVPRLGTYLGAAAKGEESG